MNKILNEFVVNTTEYNGIIEYDEKYKLHVVLRNNKNLDCSIRVIKK